MPDLSIIILSYKSKADLQRLLPSVFASQTRYSFETLVVDNGSKDGTAEWVENQLAQAKYPSLKLLKNQNTGFAHGNNLGIRQAAGKYVLLLNPDTQIGPDTLETMLGFMEERPEVGISGCRVQKPDGSLDLACRRKFPNPWNAFARLFLLSRKNYNLLDRDENLPQQVDSVMGAFLLIRKSVMEKIGLLDESFFMYGEDLDWCWRCKAAGYQVWYYPKTKITHFKGSSSKKTPFRALKWFHDAMWIFYRKHYAGQYPFVLNWLVWLGIYGRLAALVILNALKKEKLVSK